MSAKPFDPRRDKQFKDFVRGEHMVLAARAEAQRAESERLWTPPPQPTTLYEQLEEGVPEVDWVIEDLVPAGNVQVNAQQKAGKTTLVMNMVRALLVNEPFLGRFRVNVRPDTRIAYLNMELPKQQFLAWLADMQVPADAAKRLDVYHARQYGFGALDFRNDRAVDWIVSWLRDNGVDTLAADPLGALYNAARWGGGDPNAAYLQWWARLEEVVRLAELRCVLIAHHTGFAEASAGRARGASAMMDKPDVNMSYRHNGEHGGKPPDAKRYLAAYGRDVDIDEFEIDYAEPTRRLFATGAGSRVDAETEKQAERCRDAVLSFAKAGEQPNKTELFRKLGWDTVGRAAGDSQRWYEVARTRGYIATERDGRATLHSPGDGLPKRMQKHRVARKSSGKLERKGS